MNRNVLFSLLFAVALFTALPRTAPAQVLAGIDVLERDHFQQLAGRKIGLITNHTGANARGVSTVKLFHDSPNVNLVALFSPEHGFAGVLDHENIGDQRDSLTGLKVHSLYGKTRVPTPEMLAGIDTLVFDIQDIGTRFYTYISTMGGAMKAAAEHRVRFVVLDRPNPIDGITVQGPVLDRGGESFVGYHPISVRHGMTIAELARMFQAEWKLDLDLQTIPIEGWNRREMFDATGRLWINPSPNMRSLNQALLYPGIGLLETTNVSVGRGTDTPFELLGAPWIDALTLARELNAAALKGVRFVPVEFTPNASKYESETCGGVNIIVIDRASFDPLETGLLLAITLHRLYPKDWKTTSLNRLLVSEKTRDGILDGKSIDELQAAYQNELNDFIRRREAFLLYR
ncbi:hypothetical protein Pla52o_49930 [Novipirellula galeiformis]|uniref:DUF1343 domain-containing protein n=1 Tax=Novipirellula galeiformis TaxID=2528004 RepID=A0A5C6C0U5_9BACT|nr:DUF1343 domain-containing protein [Novipirellula galeiformis]TWU17778.1 hypothetical protein Pla52o_49930 [Novipirellula galeiformis]